MVKSEFKVETGVSKRYYWLCFSLNTTGSQLPITQDKNRSFFINLVSNGVIKADRDGARLPACLGRQSAFIFP